MNIVEKVNYALAQGSWYGVTNPFSSSFETVVGTRDKVVALINLGSNISGLVAVVLLIYGAFTLTISAGDPEKQEKGRNIITNSIIGLVVILLARMVILFIYERVLVI